MKRFLGWEPSTSYTYDDGGRLLSSRPEQEWDDVEQSWMLALQFYRDAMVCPKCGGPVSECQDPANEGRFKMDPPVRCHRTTALDAGSEPYRKDTNVKAADALLYRVVLPES